MSKVSPFNIILLCYKKGVDNTTPLSRISITSTSNFLQFTIYFLVCFIASFIAKYIIKNNII